MSEKLCPVCGSNKIGLGRHTAQGAMYPIGKIFASGSEVIAEICTDCGHILSMKVKHPEKFR